MKNILIISQFFAPQNIIAAIRFTKVVKYLAATGEYHFWVITKKEEEGAPKDDLLIRDIEGVADYVTIVPIDMEQRLLKRLKTLFRKETSNKAEAGSNETRKCQDNAYFMIQEKYVSCTRPGLSGSIKRGIGRLVVALNAIYDLLFEYLFLVRGSRKLKQIPMTDMDVVISSYGRIGAHLLGQKCKTSMKELHWIADYRDPVTAACGMVQKYLLHIAQRIDRKADYITGATSSCIGSGKYLQKFHIIQNGYDIDDLRDFAPKSDNEKLTISYTGNLYYHKSDISQLFHIISDLKKEGKADPERIAIVYAGKQTYIVEGEAKKYNLEKIIDYRGVVPRQESIKIQWEADMLCALTWNNEGNDNILTGKIFEYFMMRKPIIAIVSGNKPDSIMKQIIEEAELGCCLEEVMLDRDYEKAKAWFSDRYQEFVCKGHLICNPKEEVLQKYCSQEMAEKFGNLIRSFGV